MENAYAKFKGSWDLMGQGGLPEDALSDLTGLSHSYREFPMNTFEAKEFIQKDNIVSVTLSSVHQDRAWKFLKWHSAEKKLIVACSFQKLVKTMGIVDAHAYFVFEMDLKFLCSREVCLILIRIYECLCVDKCECREIAN